MKISICEITNNSLDIKNKSKEYENEMIKYDRLMGSRELFSNKQFSKGTIVFGLNGQKGIVDEQDGNNLSVNGRWYNGEEFKDSPWTNEERESFNSFILQKRKEREEKSKEVINIIDEKKRLRKEFLGR